MNIFFLSLIPSEIAEMSCDQHVVKIQLEICQMLYTAWYFSNEEEYLQENALSHRATQVGTRHYYNPRFSQHNARQQFTAQNFATGIYMTHMHQVRDTNQLEFQCMVNSTQSMSVTWGDGYMTLTELSVDQFGNTV